MIKTISSLKKILLVSLLFFIPLKNYSFELRNEGEAFIGLIGGYGFPQLAVGEYNKAHVSPSKGKAYNFGFIVGGFFTDFYALTGTINYNYTSITYKKEAHFIQRYVNIGLNNEFYFIDIIFLGIGGYVHIPVITNNPQELLHSKTTIGGADITFGVDIKLPAIFSVRVGVEFDFPFNKIFARSYDTTKNHRYTIYSMPISFILGLEWPI
jgi:hypothetical protein